MAKRKVNTILGASAGRFGLDNFTTTLAGVTVLAGAPTFLASQNIVAGVIAGTAAGLLFQLITNGKPGAFINSTKKRPNWVRGQCRYVNEWAPDYKPVHKGLEYSRNAFVVCGLLYCALGTLWPLGYILGVPIFALPLVPWQRFFRP